MSREKGYKRMSDAQLNAVALDRRDAPYRAAHDASVIATRQPGARPRAGSLRSLARNLIRDFAMETPSQLHFSVSDETGLNLAADGVPEMVPAFLSFLDSHPDSTDAGDPGDISHGTDEQRAQAVIIGYYKWPNRATLWLMTRSARPRLARLGHIVEAIVRQDEFSVDPVHAAIRYGAHPDDAEDVAQRALEAFVARRAALRLRLPRVES